MFAFRNIEPNERRIYKEIDGLSLPMDIYLPKCGIEKAKGCVVSIHGGGWNKAIMDNSTWDGGDMRFNARYYADKGYIAIAFSYRSLKAKDGLTVFDLMEDCQDAMRYIQSNLPYVDYSKIVLIGDSAGGHLATMTGISQDDSLRPYAVVACNPVLDCTKWGYAFVGREKELLACSPYHQKPEKCAKFLFVHGTADPTVACADTVDFYEKLADMGHEVELVLLQNRMHAFILFDYRYSDEEVVGFMQQIDSYLGKIL